MGADDSTGWSEMKLTHSNSNRYTTIQESGSRFPEANVPYLIDGHNLIAALPDLSLQDPDDEQELIRRMNAYCQRIRHKAILFFDRGRSSSRPYSSGHWLRIRFVRPPRTADDAIRAELDRIGREAPNWTVVSSDREVQLAARQAGARSLSSRDFIGQIDHGDESERPDKTVPALGSGELDEWLSLFGAGDGDEQEN
jgi:predicted RNA-binding protein with PIN domain